MACPVTITAINTACGTNMAGISDVWIGNFGLATYTYAYQQDEDGHDILDPDGNKIRESITAATLAGTETMQHFGFRKQTGSMTSTLQVNDNGTNFWQTDIQLVFAKMDTVKRLSIMSLMQGQTSVLVKDNNGNYWMVGIDNYVTMSEGTGETGTAYSDNNAYTITLQDTATILPLPVAAAAVETLTESGDEPSTRNITLVWGAGIASVSSDEQGTLTGGTAMINNSEGITFTANSGSTYQWYVNNVAVEGDAGTQSTYNRNFLVNSYVSCTVSA